MSTLADIKTAESATAAAAAAHTAQCAASWEILSQRGYLRSQAPKFGPAFFHDDREGLAAWQAMNRTMEAVRDAERVRWEHEPSQSGRWDGFNWLAGA